MYAAIYPVALREENLDQKHGVWPRWDSGYDPVVCVQFYLLWNIKKEFPSVGSAFLKVQLCRPSAIAISDIDLLFSMLTFSSTSAAVQPRFRTYPKLPPTSALANTASTGLVGDALPDVCRIGRFSY